MIYIVTCMYLHKFYFINSFYEIPFRIFANSCLLNIIGIKKDNQDPEKQKKSEVWQENLVHETRTSGKIFSCHCDVLTDFSHAQF